MKNCGKREERFCTEATTWRRLRLVFGLAILAMVALSAQAQTATGVNTKTYAQVPGSILQLFYRGADNSLYTRWRNPDGSWSGEQHLGGILNGDPFAARVPGTNILQLFYRGADNSVYTRWRNPDGTWSSEQHLGGILDGDPIAAQVPGSNILQLFYRGADLSLIHI